MAAGSRCCTTCINYGVRCASYAGRDAAEYVCDGYDSVASSGKDTLMLFLFTRDGPVGYDEYDAVLIAASTPERARYFISHEMVSKNSGRLDNCLPYKPDPAKEDYYDGFKAGGFGMKIVGMAAPGVKEGELISSFNAG